MGSNINGRFSDQNDIALTGIVQSSNNNQSTLNAVISETDQVRGSSVILQPTGLLTNLTNDVPNVTQAAQGTIGAALGSVGQQGTPALEPGGGGNPCFIGVTRIATPTGDVHLREIQLGETVWGFDDETGERTPQRVIAKWEHLVQEYTLIEFEDGRATGLIDIHKYWTRPGYKPISKLDEVWHWSHNAWVKCAITRRTVIKGEITVYNLSIEGTKNYMANGDGVSNLKPLGGNES